jgi:isochorismate synthase
VPLQPTGNIAAAVLIPRPALAELGAALRALPDGLRVAAVEVEIDPLDLVRAGGGAFASATFYSSPGGRAVGGLGAAWAATSSGPERFAVLDRGLRRAVPAGVEALIGFAFAPGGPESPDWEGFPAASVVVPQIAVSRDGGRSRLRVAVPAGANPAQTLAAAATLRLPGVPGAPAAAGVARAVPPVGEWIDRVAEAVAVIRGGGPSKVVLARALRVGLERPADPFDLVALLRDRCPGCHAYGWQAGAAAFIGASPELLISKAGERFEARPLAGSAPRGDDAEADRRLGDRLLASSKDRAEHAFVVDEVVAALAPFADTMDRPPGPCLEQVTGVQHLATPVGGTTGSRLLALVEALHPTAAVGGVPRAEALEYIAEVEGLDRGWYAGGVGWAEPGGDGEVAVALRCVLLRGEEALLYAGAGIVAGSDPGAELAETDLKMGPTLGLFGAG